MRRIGRWMLNALTALSLLILGLSIVMWPRSYRVLETVAWVPRQISYGVASERGRIAFYWWTRYAHPYSHLQEWRYYQFPAWRLADGALYGDKADEAIHGYVIRWGPYGGRLALPSGIVVVPFWFVALCASSPLVFRQGRQILRKRSQREGRCRSCLYDLTANVSGVCPECGTKIEGTR